MLARGGEHRCCRRGSCGSSGAPGAATLRSLQRRLQPQRSLVLRAAAVVVAAAAAGSDGGGQPPPESSGSAAPPAAAPAAAAAAGPTDWAARRKQRLVRDLVEASRRLGPAFTPEALAAGCDTLEGLLPGLQIDVERLPARDWACLALETPAAAAKIVLLKTLLPRADLAAIVQREPKLLLLEPATLEAKVRQVLRLLATGGYGVVKNPDALVTALPSMLEPRVAMSVLVTVRKWYAGSSRTPVDILEADPQLVLRAQACGVPLDPVYGSDGDALEAPGLAYLERRAPWQAYLDQKLNRNKPGQMAPSIPAPRAPGGGDGSDDGGDGSSGGAAAAEDSSGSNSSASAGEK